MNHHSQLYEPTHHHADRGAREKYKSGWSRSTPAPVQVLCDDDTEILRVHRCPCPTCGEMLMQEPNASLECGTCSDAFWGAPKKKKAEEGSDEEEEHYLGWSGEVSPPVGREGPSPDSGIEQDAHQRKEEEEEDFTFFDLSPIIKASDSNSRRPPSRIDVLSSPCESIADNSYTLHYATLNFGPTTKQNQTKVRSANTTAKHPWRAEEELYGWEFTAEYSGCGSVGLCDGWSSAVIIPCFTNTPTFKATDLFVTAAAVCSRGNFPPGSLTAGSTRGNGDTRLRIFAKGVKSFRLISFSLCLYTRSGVCRHALDLLTIPRHIKMKDEGYTGDKPATARGRATRASVELKSLYVTAGPSVPHEVWEEILSYFCITPSQLPDLFHRPNERLAVSLCGKVGPSPPPATTITSKVIATKKSEPKKRTQNTTSKHKAVAVASGGGGDAENPIFSPDRFSFLNVFDRYHPMNPKIKQSFGKPHETIFPTKKTQWFDPGGGEDGCGGWEDCEPSYDNYSGPYDSRVDDGKGGWRYD